MAVEKHETRLGRQKVTRRTFRTNILSRAIGVGTRTPRTEKTKSTVIRFGRGTLSGRGNIIATHDTTIIA
jgi:hypothetical protein